MLKYKFVFRCSSTYIGRTCQRLEVRIRQHVPRVILTKSQQISGHSKAMDSAIGKYLLTINPCTTSYEDDCFSFLHRARDKIHLNVLEAIYIAINDPPLCRQLSSHILNIFWEVLETGVTWTFLTLSLQSNYLIYTPFLIIFSVTKLDKSRTKGPSLFYCFNIVSPFTNDFVIHLFIYISITHPRYIKVGPQWCTVFIADFGFFFASYRLRQKPWHDSGRVKTPPWSRRGTLVPLPKQKKEK